MAYVAGKAHVVTGILHDVVDERSGGCLAVRASDANHLGIGISTGKLNLRDDGCALCPQLLDHGGFLGNARTFDNLVGRKDERFGVLTFLPLNTILVELLLILWFDGGEVGHKHVESLQLGQYGGSCSALGGSEYYYAFHRYRIFSVMIVMAASRMVTIQNLIVIMFS